MHLGRRPSGLPDSEAAGAELDPLRLDPRAAWQRTVDLALQSRVDAVLLAGDVVDSGNHFMEAYAPLREGAVRLTRAGIDLVAVAGNHDVEALPRLADEIGDLSGEAGEGRFVLLGRGATWSSHLVRRDGEPVARVLGWSFANRRETTSPLASLPSSLRSGRYEDGAPDELLTVGLLHCDLGATGSPYAPVGRSELVQLGDGFSGWFLGHVHVPGIASGELPVGYLGSLVGMDAGETGPHGPWLATRDGSRWQLDQHLLSPVRWECREVDITGCADREQVESALVAGLRALAQELEGETDFTRVVGVRLTLVGRTALPEAELLTFCGREQKGRLSHPEGDTLYFLDRVLVQTRKERDLASLAGGSGPLATAARQLLALEEGGPEREALVRRARPALEKAVDRQELWNARAGVLTDEEVLQHLRTAASRLVDQLLEQGGEVAPALEEVEA